MNVAPTCFISYSWDDKEHKQWVLRLATSLQSAGVHVFLDQWDVHPGMDLTKYMETSIRESNYVLLVCTSIFATKANARKGGVGYEQMVVTGEIFQQTASEKKFIPILRRGSREEAVPSFLGSRVTVDFRLEADYQDSLEELLRHMHATPISVRPPLGPPPKFADKAALTVPAMAVAAPAPIATVPVPFDTKLFEALETFAFSRDGLNLSTRGAAKKWAEDRMLSWKDVEVAALVKRFEALDTFAFSRDGLNLSTRGAAKKWAEDRMLSWKDVDIAALVKRFEALDTFAFSRDGLNLSTRVAAKKWAEDRMLSWKDVDIAAFVKRFEELETFAFSRDGLNLSTRAAAKNWAYKHVCSELNLENT